jgi:hypothetical protein
MSRPKQKRRLAAEPPFPTNANQESNSFANHELQQVRHAAAIAPLVVIPAHQLEETLVQLDARATVKDGRGLAVNEIRADDLV